MTKQLLVLLTALVMVTACGGGSGGSTPSSSEQPDTSGGSNPGTNGDGDGGPQQNSSFEYPDQFKDFDTFKNVVSFSPVAAGYAQDYASFLIVSLVSKNINFLQGYPLTLVKKSSAVNRSHCVIGSLAESSVVYNDDSTDSAFTSGSGTIVFDNFSGMEVELVGETPAECSYSTYIDGYIQYDRQVSDDLNTDFFTADFRKPGAASEPFFFHSPADGSFDSADAFIGSIKHTTTGTNNNPVTINTFESPSLEVFTVNASSNALYVKSPYEKSEPILFKNARLELKTDDNANTLTYNNNYERIWDENGSSFVLHTTTVDLLYDEEIRDFISGSVALALSVENDLSKTVSAEVIYRGNQRDVTYTKEGVTNSATVTSFFNP